VKMGSQGGQDPRTKVDSCVNRRSLKLTIERNGPHECQSNPATACAGCVKRKTPCIIASDVLALPVVLPLPERHREGFGRQDPGF
jgi:hypothetical protein